MANMPSMKDVVEIVAPIVFSWYQADRINWDQKRQNSEIHVMEQHMATDMFRRDVQLSKQQQVMGTAADIELTLAQMQADLSSAMKEAERDQYDQRNQQLQTIIIAASLMMTALYTLLIQGYLPQATLVEYAGPYSEGFAIAIAAAEGCSLCLLFTSVVLCIETLRLASAYMVKRARSDLTIYHYRRNRVKALLDDKLHLRRNFAKDDYYSASKLNAYAGEVEKASAQMSKGKSTARGGGLPYLPGLAEKCLPGGAVKGTLGPVLEEINPNDGIDTDTFETDGDVEARKEKPKASCKLLKKPKNGRRGDEINDDDPYRSTEFMWDEIQLTCRQLAMRFVEDEDGDDESDVEEEEEDKGEFRDGSGRRIELLDFETFWKVECQSYHEWATLSFYGGTLSLLAGTILWCFLQFKFAYASATAAYVIISFLLAGVVTGVVLWLTLVRSGKQGIFKKRREARAEAACVGCGGGGGCGPCSSSGGGARGSVGSGAKGGRAQVMGGVLPPPPPPTAVQALPRPLHYACEIGAPVETVKILLQSQPDAVADVDQHGECALHVAVANNAPLPVVRMLLKAHPAAVGERNHARQLPIDIAYKKHPKNLKLQATVKAAEADRDGNLPLHHICRLSPQQEPACDADMLAAYPSASKLKISSYLLAFPEAAMVRGKGGNLPLHVVCSNKSSRMAAGGVDVGAHIDAMVLALLPEEMDRAAKQRQASAANLQGSLPLHLVCQSSARLNVVNALLKAYPKAVKVKDAKGYLPIHYAVEGRAGVEVLQALADGIPSDDLSKSVSTIIT